METRIDKMLHELSNWGRWGNADELGTLNLITAAKRREAARSVVSGAVYSLALTLTSTGPQPTGSGRRNLRHTMVQTGIEASSSPEAVAFSDDEIAMAVHGATHWDALSHVFHRGRMYNDRAAKDVDEFGARTNSIVPVARTTLTRGILIDVARYLETLWLPSDYEITASDLEGAIASQNVALSTGDALLVRTGHLGRIRESGRWDLLTEINGVLPSEPGIGVSCLPWLHERGVAAIAADNWAVEHLSGPTGPQLPVHVVGIVGMGLLLGEMFDLDDLALACAADSRYDFLLAAGPLPIEGGVGGPVNPQVVR